MFVARQQLGEDSQYFSTTDICNLVNKFGLRKNKYVNNVGRIFIQNTNALFEVKLTGSVKKYRLSNTGFSYAKTILRNFSFDGQ